MIKLQNGSYHMGDHGDKQAVMDLLVAFTKEKGHEVTRQEVLGTETMPHPNTIGSYVDGGFDNAVRKAFLLAFPKEEPAKEENESSPTAKKAEKKEKPPMSREEILKKVTTACFQHGDNTGWINDSSLRNVIPMRDFYKAFQGGVKELRNAVKAILWEQKHPNKPVKEPQPLAQTVVIPEEVLKSVASEESIVKEESVTEESATRATEPASALTSADEAAEDFSVDDIESYEVIEESIVESEPEEPEEAAPIREAIDVAANSKMTKEEVEKAYLGLCEEKGYIVLNAEVRQHCKENPGKFPCWSTITKNIGDDWYDWSKRYGLPFKDDRTERYAANLKERKTGTKPIAAKDTKSQAAQSKPQSGPESQLKSKPQPEPKSELTPRPELKPAVPIPRPETISAPVASSTASGREFIYPIRVILPEGVTGTITFQMNLNVTITV